MLQARLPCEHLTEPRSIRALESSSVYRARLLCASAAAGEPPAACSCAPSSSERRRCEASQECSRRLRGAARSLSLSSELQRFQTLQHVQPARSQKCQRPNLQLYWYQAIQASPLTLRPPARWLQLEPPWASTRRRQHRTLKRTPSLYQCCQIPKPRRGALDELGHLLIILATKRAYSDEGKSTRKKEASGQDVLRPGVRTARNEHQG